MSYWAKDTLGFVRRDRSLEPPLHDQDGYLTSNDRFFVCNSGTTPRIDADTYALNIHGDGVTTPLQLSFDDLQAMPRRSVPAVLECAGNHRAMFETVLGAKLDKRPQVTELMWNTGAVGMAEWRGVPLCHVLEQAGITSSAYHVCPRGSETDSREGDVRVPMPVAKAMDIDTIIALEMNGEPLPPDHGYPARIIVPGWIGTYSVKWVREIEVSNNHITVTRNTEFYVLKGNDWPADGTLITEQNLKSSLALPWPAPLSAGEHLIHGFARSPDALIAAVHWSDDLGETWHPADLTGPNEKYGWVRFQFPWRALKGEHVLMTRATDQNGRSQPSSVPFNTGGYLFNAIHPHRVTVT